jgi:hypothetical protein
MVEVYPDIESITAIRQKHALQMDLLTFRRDIVHEERVLKADDEVLTCCRKRMDMRLNCMSSKLALCHV